MSEDDYSEIKGLPPSFFAEKREYFLKNLKKRFSKLNINSIIVFQGADDIPKYDSDTSYYYFEQEPNFYYLTGVRFPHMRCIIDVANGKCDLFYAKEDDDNKIWQKVPSEKEIEEKYEITTHNMKELYPFIQQRNMDVIYILSGTNGNSGLPVISADLDFPQELDYLNKRISHDVHVYEALCECRMIKLESEYKLLKYIARISAEGHNEMMKAIQPGMNERDMENVFNNYLRNKYYCRFFAYMSICASGKDCATLHYMLNNKTMEDNTLFLSDQGIRFCGYDADITTTFPVNGKFTQEQKDIYNAVLNSNLKLEEIVQAGKITKKELDNFSKKVILQGLKDIGILTKDADIEDLFNKGMARIFMPHSFGHYLGLDCHDVGPNIEWRTQQIITAGMYITNEPGIYFIDMLLEEAKGRPELSPFIDWDKVEQYKKVGGVRIEDNFMVFEDHIESLQGDIIPRTVEDIEKYMAENNPWVKEHYKNNN